MKKYKNRISLIVLCSILTCVGFIGCEKKDSDTLFGDNFIYLPQSTQSGGVSLNYAVPTGKDTNTYNFKIDSIANKVNVILGVNRSGLVDLGGYTVDVKFREDTISTIITNKLITTAKPLVLLPSAAYTLPNNVTVATGSYRNSFYLSIDKTILKTYAGKFVAACVVISNPSQYAVSPTNNQVIVLIDVDALKL